MVSIINVKLKFFNQRHTSILDFILVHQDFLYVWTIVENDNHFSGEISFANQVNFLIFSVLLCNNLIIFRNFIWFRGRITFSNVILTIIWFFINLHFIIIFNKYLDFSIFDRNELHFGSILIFRNTYFIIWYRICILLLVLFDNLFLVFF